MSLDQLYGGRVEDAIQRQLKNPGPAPAPSSFGLWGFLAAGAKGPASGGLESIASGADFLSMFAAPAAATFGAMDYSGVVDQQGVEQARQRVIKGNSFDPTAGDILRRKADEFAPNPETSSHADQVVHGLTRGLSKAVGDAVTLGPLAGPVAFGIDEGNNAGQRLRMDGVDSATAAKVGAVTGIASALGAGIPIGGSTIAKTAALVATGGPATFMAQEALSKRILAEAGYNDQASLHDPLDPLGLSLSLAPGAIFGGIHLRGVAKRKEAVSSGRVPLSQMTLGERQGLKYDSPELDAYAAQAAEANGVPPAVLLAVKNAGEKSGVTQYGPQTRYGKALGVMQFLESTAKENGVTNRADPLQSIDGGARYLKKLYDAYGSWDAAVAHYNGGGSQAVLVRGGAKPSFPETAKYLERVQRYMEDHAVARGASDPDVVDAARVKVTNAALHQNLPDFPQAHAEVMRASDELAAGRFPEVKAPSGVRSSDEVQAAARAFDVDSAGARLPEPSQLTAPRAPTVDEMRTLSSVESVPLDKAVSFQSKRQWDRFASGDHPGALIDGYGDKPIALRLQTGEYVIHDGNHRTDLARQAGERTMDMHVIDVKAYDPEAAGSRPAAKPSGAADDALLAQLSNELSDFATSPVRTSPRARSEGTNALPDPRQPAIESAAPKISADIKGKGPASIDSQRVAALAKTDPGLKVKLPGSDETLTVGEALERAKAEAKEEGDYAKLIKAAADCALSFGA